jgi:predicted DNA-binding protein (MmcQ/YjbR family)
MRAVCLALPGSIEIVSHGHPAFSNGKRIYAVLEEYRGDLSLCVKVGLDVQAVFLKDPRFYLTPYIGKQGWVSLKVHAAPIDWSEIGGLLEGSHAACRTPARRRQVG